MVRFDGPQGFKSTSGLLGNNEVVTPLSPDAPSGVKEKQKKAQSESIFSKYDTDNNHVVSVNEQRIALTHKVSNLYHNLKKNMNMTVIDIIKKFSNNFSDIKTDGTVDSAKQADQQIDSMLDTYANNIVKVLTEGNSRTEDFKSQSEFANSPDLKPGDYHVSQKGNILQYNGKHKNWSLYTAK